DIHAFVLPDHVSHVAPVGAAAGAFPLADALRQGVQAANDAAEALGRTSAAHTLPNASDDAVSLSPLWRVKDSRDKAFVDFQNDVTASDIDLAVREGFRNLEHLKRYTTLGMGSDQGKTSNANGFAILAEINGAPMAGAGAILARPPESSVPIAAF